MAAKAWTNGSSLVSYVWNNITVPQRQPMIGGLKCRRHAGSACSGGLVCYAEIPGESILFSHQICLSVFAGRGQRFRLQKTWPRGEKILPSVLPLLNTKTLTSPVVGKLADRGDKESSRIVWLAKGMEQVKWQRTHASPWPENTAIDT